MKPTRIHPHRQLAIDGQPVAEQSLLVRIAMIIGSMALMLGALALAQHWDEQAEAELLASNLRTHQQVDKMREQKEWLHKMANAYAQGQQDALQACTNSQTGGQP